MVTVIYIIIITACRGLASCRWHGYNIAWRFTLLSRDTSLVTPLLRAPFRSFYAFRINTSLLVKAYAITSVGVIAILRSPIWLIASHITAMTWSLSLPLRHYVMLATRRASINTDRRQDIEYLLKMTSQEVALSRCYTSSVVKDDADAITLPALLQARRLLMIIVCWSMVTPRGIEFIRDELLVVYGDMPNTLTEHYIITLLR